MIAKSSLNVQLCGSGRVARGGVEPPTFRFSGGVAVRLRHVVQTRYPSSAARGPLRPEGVWIGRVRDPYGTPRPQPVGTHGASGLAGYGSRALASGQWRPADALGACSDAVRTADASFQDWIEIWPILRQVAQAGETFCWPRDISEDQARAYWMQPPPNLTLILLDAGAVVGTATLHPNHAGPAAHVANASFAIDPRCRGRGSAANWPRTRSPGRAPRATVPCSSTRSSKRTRERSRCGSPWGSGC